MVMTIMGRRVASGAGTLPHGLALRVQGAGWCGVCRFPPTRAHARTHTRTRMGLTCIPITTLHPCTLRLVIAVSSAVRRRVQTDAADPPDSVRRHVAKTGRPLDQAAQPAVVSNFLAVL